MFYLLLLISCNFKEMFYKIYIIKFENILIELNKNVL